MYKHNFYTSAREVPNPLARTKARKARVVTARLAKSKNFWKVDRSLDDYIDRTKLIKCGPKRLLKKLLTLRKREDGNEVQITVAGLSKLMAVNIKTIRSWFKSLEDAGFVFYQGNDWDPHRNYPKKKYAFPDTFPGFDLATVFIQKGAKAKYKKRMANPVKAKARARKVDRLTAKTTCPENDRFIDCSPSINRRETQNSSEDTKVSSKEILELETRPATPTRVSRTKTFKRKPVLDLVPELKSILTTVLAERGYKGKIKYVSHFIERCLSQDQTAASDNERQELAEDLLLVMTYGFLADQKSRSPNFLNRLLRFLREYLSMFISTEFYKSARFHIWLMGPGWGQMDKRADFMKEYPFCDPDDYSMRTCVNRSWGF